MVEGLLGLWNALNYVVLSDCWSTGGTSLYSVTGFSGMKNCCWYFVKPVFCKVVRTRFCTYWWSFLWLFLRWIIFKRLMDSTTSEVVVSGRSKRPRSILGYNLFWDLARVDSLFIISWRVPFYNPYCVSGWSASLLTTIYEKFSCLLECSGGVTT